MQWNIDSLIFIGFLLINLVVGLFYGRGVKTISDYALGGRNFSTAALVSTIVATFITGSSFFVDLSNTYSDGLLYIIPVLAVCLQLFIVGVFLVPRMGEFMGALSVAEMMGNLYGNKVRLITAVCGILLNVGYIAVQFKVFGSLINYFIGASPSLGIIIASTIVILYSAFGGIRAVTYTDMLQFFTFGFVIPMIGIMVWNEFQAVGMTVTNALKNPLFDYHQLFNLKGKELFSFIFLIIYFAFPTIAPTDFQRISMGRNVSQVRTAIIISTILVLVVILATAWIPFLIANINPNLPPSDITSYIVNNYTYTGLKGLMIIGITAMAMSSADSFINGSAVLFAYDLKEILGIKVNNLLLSRLFSLGLGICAIYLALSTNDLLSMVMTMASFYMPIIAVPLLLSVLGFRSSAKSVLISMIAGFITVIIGMIYKIDDLMIPAMMINTTVLFGSHYLLKQPGGFVGIKDQTYLNEIRAERKRKIAKLIKKFTTANFIEFCKKTAPKNEILYSWVGIYFVSFTISTMYSTHVALLKDNGNMILALFQIMMCTGVITAMYPIWPSRIKHEIIMQIAWHIIIFYMLIVLSCFFVMLSDFGQLQFTIFTINILITAILVGWRISLVMSIAGFYCSLILYKYYSGIDNLNISIGSPGFIFMYSLIIVGSSIIMFLKPKQEQQTLTEEKNEHLRDRIEDSEKELSLATNLKGEFIRNITHEYHAPLTGIISMVQILKKAYHSLSDELRLEAIDAIHKSSLRLEEFDDNLNILSKLSNSSYKLIKKPINLSDLIYERVKICQDLYESEESKENNRFILDIGQDVVFDGDEYYLIKTIDNLIINAITYCKQGKISISLRQTNEQIVFRIEDEGIGIPTAELHDIFSEFVVSSKTRSLAGNRGIGLALCKRVIELHGGEIKAESNGIKGAKFSFIMPILQTL